jgi:hypothetical protein
MLVFLGENQKKKKKGKKKKKKKSTKCFRFHLYIN